MAAARFSLCLAFEFRAGFQHGLRRYSLTYRSPCVDYTRSVSMGGGGNWLRIDVKRLANLAREIDVLKLINQERGIALLVKVGGDGGAPVDVG